MNDNDKYGIDLKMICPECRGTGWELLPYHFQSGGTCEKCEGEGYIPLISKTYFHEICCPVAVFFY